MRKSRLAVSVIFWLVGFVVSNWLARIPAIQEHLHASTGALGATLLASAIGALIAMPLAGHWTTRCGSRRVCQIALPLFCLSLPPLGLVPSLPALFVALFLFGATCGALDIAMNAQGLAVEELYRRPVMSSFHALFSFGGMCGAAAGGLVAKFGIAPSWHFAAAALSAYLAGLAALPPLLPHSGIQAHGPTFAMPRGPLLKLGLLAIFVLLGEGAMGDWSALYMTRLPNVTQAQAAAGYAVFSLAMAGGRFVGDRLNRRFGPVALVRTGGALAAAGLALALLVPHRIAALTGYAAVGAGFATIVPLVFTAAGRTPGIAPGVGLASVTTMGYFGFLAGPPLIGMLADYLTLRGALWLVVLLNVLIVMLSSSVRAARPSLIETANRSPASPAGSAYSTSNPALETDRETPAS